MILIYLKNIFLILIVTIFDQYIKFPTIRTKYSNNCKQGNFHNNLDSKLRSGEIVLFVRNLQKSWVYFHVKKKLQGIIMNDREK